MWEESVFTISKFERSWKNDVKSGFMKVFTSESSMSMVFESSYKPAYLWASQTILKFFSITLQLPSDFRTLESVVKELSQTNLNLFRSSLVKIVCTIALVLAFAAQVQIAMSNLSKQRARN